MGENSQEQLSYFWGMTQIHISFKTAFFAGLGFNLSAAIVFLGVWTLLEFVG